MYYRRSTFHRLCSVRKVGDKMEKRIYVDNAATTKVSTEVFKAMEPYFNGVYGNPSSIYAEGREAKQAVETAREQVAKAINASSKEIYFTGSGSEADNWAIRSVAKGMFKKGNHNHINGRTSRSASYLSGTGEGRV